MNKQLFNIIKQILNNYKSTLDCESMIKQNEISSRMLYNYGKEISFYCDSINKRGLITFEDGCFRFNGGEIDRKYFCSWLESLSFDNYRLNNKERRTIITVLLASSLEPVKINDLMDVLVISKNTINADLKAVKDYLSCKNVGFDKNKRNGLLLNCSYLQKIELILDSIKSIKAIDDYYLSSPINPAVSYMFSYLKIEKYRSVVEKLISEVEESTNCKLSDHYFFKLVFILSLLLNRKENHWYYPTIEKDSVGKDKFVVALIGKLNEQKLLDDNEAEHFSRLLHKYRIRIYPGDKLDNPKYVNSIIKAFLAKLSSIYGLDLSSDKVLVDYLNAHILACYHRVIENEQIDNPYLKQIEEKYCNDFKLIKENIFVIENGLNISLNDGEVAYILLHILSALDRNKEDRLPSIALVCSSGVATSNYVSQQIKNHFKCHILPIKTIHDLEKLTGNEKIDLIISTIPLPKSSIETLIVNPILQKEDFANIYKALDKFSSIEIVSAPANQAKDVENSDSVKMLFDISRIKLDVEASDWQQAIIKSAEDMLWQNMITPNYVHQMINLVKKYGPYIVISKEIALAHAAGSDGVIIPGASIIRLAKPVKFGKEGFDPVSVIICSAIEDSPEYVNALMKVISMAKNPQFLEHVKKAQSAYDIVELFK